MLSASQKQARAILGNKTMNNDNSITEQVQLVTLLHVDTANTLETHGDDVNTMISVRMPRATSDHDDLSIVMIYMIQRLQQPVTPSSKCTLPCFFDAVASILRV